jgi:methyl-accepting chemotaxis protein
MFFSVKPRISDLQYFVLISCFAVGVFSGCDTFTMKDKTPDSLALRPAVDPMTLKASVMLAADKAFADIAGTAGTIASRTTDRKVRENTLRWKIRAYDMMQTVYMEPDPRIAFLSAWTSAVQLRKYVTEGEGKDLFADQQPLAIETAKQIETDMVNLGRTHFSSECIDTAIDDIEMLAGTFVASSTSMSERISAAGYQQSDLYRIITLPMLPIRGVHGVADAPGAIMRFTAVTQDFSKIIQQLPERSRWQLELLMLEAESLSTVEKAVRQIEELQENIKRISDIAESMPAQTRKELEGFTDTLEKTQPSLQVTTTQIYESIKSIKESLALADAVIQNADKTAGTVNEAIRNITLTADAWRQTTSEIRNLFSDVNQPFAADSRALQISSYLRELVNEIFLRCVVLVILIFVMLYVYVILKTKLKNR